jgi:hypothetical protein
MSQEKKPKKVVITDGDENSEPVEQKNETDLKNNAIKISVKDESETTEQAQKEPLKIAVQHDESEDQNDDQAQPEETNQPELETDSVEDKGAESSEIEDGSEQVEASGPTQDDLDDTGSDQEDAAEEQSQPEKVGEDEKVYLTVEEAIERAETDESVDAETNDAVDEIVREESDELLDKQDETLLEPEQPKTKKSLKQKIGDACKYWWHHKYLRYGTIVVIFLAVVGSLLVPVTRYGILNTVGVRVKSSLRVIDAQSRLPLEGIAVQLQDKSLKTDEEGIVRFESLRLGKSQMSITKVGYADNQQTITLGWGSNPLQDQELVATGEQVTFILKDWLNNEPIVAAQANAGENSAKADENGKIILTIGAENFSEVEVVVSADGYRSETIEFSELSEDENELLMIPGRRHAFVSNRDGRYDLYAIDVNGENESLLLEATGEEREVPTLLAHPTKNMTAYVTSRDGETNNDGFVLDGLFIVDTANGQLERITRSEQLRLIGWHEDILVYWQVVEGRSRDNPQRSSLVAYDVNSQQRTELATANYFNDVRLFEDTVVYAVSSFAVPQSRAKLFQVDLKAENTRVILDEQVYTIFESTYGEFLLNAADGNWYEYVGGDSAAETTRPSQPTSRRFQVSPDATSVAWVEVRDGRGVLLVSNDDTPAEQLLSLAGLSQVMYWLNDHTLVFRVIKTGETADYVVSLDSPEPLKITDVTATERLLY